MQHRRHDNSANVLAFDGHSQDLWQQLAQLKAMLLAARTRQALGLNEDATIARLQAAWSVLKPLLEEEIEMSEQVAEGDYVQVTVNDTTVDGEVVQVVSPECFTIRVAGAPARRKSRSRVCWQHVTINTTVPGTTFEILDRMVFESDVFPGADLTALAATSTLFAATLRSMPALQMAA